MTGVPMAEASSSVTAANISRRARVGVISDAKNAWSPTVWCSTLRFNADCESIIRFEPPSELKFVTSAGSHRDQTRPGSTHEASVYAYGMHDMSYHRCQVEPIAVLIEWLDGQEPAVYGPAISTLVPRFA